MQELEKLCSSNSLSIKALRHLTNTIPHDIIVKSDDVLLHAVCENTNISKAIVEHLLRVCPSCVSKPKRGDCDDGAHPLHLAAANPNCPGSVIKLLVNKDSTLLQKVYKKRFP